MKLLWLVVTVVCALNYGKLTKAFSTVHVLPNFLNIKEIMLKLQIIH